MKTHVVRSIVTIKKQYQCDACDSIHNSRYSAEECCVPEVFEVYVCPKCKTPHDSEKEAIACCDLDPNNPIEIRPSAAELEKAGQLRLPLQEDF